MILPLVLAAAPLAAALVLATIGLIGALSSADLLRRAIGLIAAYLGAALAFAAIGATGQANAFGLVFAMLIGLIGLMFCLLAIALAVRMRDNFGGADVVSALAEADDTSD